MANTATQGNALEFHKMGNNGRVAGGTAVMNDSSTITGQVSLDPQPSLATLKP